MYVARRAGPAGRAGSTVGTLICTDFTCSRNVRRAPTPMEVGAATPEERAYWSQQRVDELRLRSLAFLGHVLAGDHPVDPIIRILVEHRVLADQAALTVGDDQHVPQVVLL